MMISRNLRSIVGTGLLVALWVGVPALAAADVVTEANAKAVVIAATNPKTPECVRTMALVQVSVFEAVNAITGKYPAFRANLSPAPNASVDAAVAAATRAVLLKLVPGQATSIEADYQAALRAIPDGPARAEGITVGEKAAAATLALREGDGADALEPYQPHTTPGRYVPTTLPLFSHWGKRKPWFMASGKQFRPGPPPRLDSSIWKRDFAEIKAVGAKESTTRTAEQTAIAKFWEVTGPTVYWPVARSVADAPGRDVSANARFLAIAATAMDDAAIAVFDAKYTYNFWRPVTAIRNAPAAARDLNWKPFIDTPMHPEYPCAHCIISGSLGAVLEAEIAGGPTPTLKTTSATAGGAERTWSSVADFMSEVASGRIYDGVHYRNSTEVGTAMGKMVGALAAKSMPTAVAAGGK